MRNTQPKSSPKDGVEVPQPSELPSGWTYSSDQLTTTEIARADEVLMRQINDEQMSSASRTALTDEMQPSKLQRIATDFSDRIGGARGSFRSSKTGIQSFVSSVGKSVTILLKNFRHRSEGANLGNKTTLTRLENKVHERMKNMLKTDLQVEFANWAEDRKVPAAEWNEQYEIKLVTAKFNQRCTALYDEHMDRLLRRIRNLLETQHHIKRYKSVVFNCNQPKAFLQEVMHDNKGASVWLKNRKDKTEEDEYNKAHKGRFAPNYTPLETHKLENGQELEYAPILADLETRGVLTKSMISKLEAFQYKLEFYRDDAFTKPDFQFPHAVI
ncbi:hypothetical protein E3P89_02308 [Wallemia ichthyophaga]|uniref:Uncharacterized protein n=1 Tax=Wallemia ichthyophaga TaxID=245174 RepID=A0A4T0H7M2_WALIC|nr:hypothetical protein E3P90_02443 [Wallemia ichthyophaga]TIB12444.1 hypothetical protein E3P93_02278 [Wallemia ichthyophaga]TIB22028.1 hypothetical protein E3P89_02308 [Wallemia ichthyophaga]TIB23788.1 hypothetical protein E3P88_02399 [Wallemia ichthyophaga]